MTNAFTPKSWQDGKAGGTPIIAAELNRLEAGVDAVIDRVNELSTSPLRRVAWKLTQGLSVKIVGVGDSILEGATVTADGGVLGTDDALSRVRTALTAAHPTATVITSNRAVSGRTAATSFIHGDFGAAIADAGDLYILGFGHNDLRSDAATPGTGYPKASMARAVEKMIRRIRDEVPGADIVLLLENPYTPAGNGSNAYLVAQNDLLLPLAAHYGVAVADSYSAFLAVGDFASLMADTGHPNAAGHGIIADTILALIPQQGEPSIPAVPGADRYGAARIGRTWESRLAVQTVAAPTQGGRYVLSGTWDSGTTAPHTTTTAASFVRCMTYGDEALLRLDCGPGTGVVDIDIDENLAEITGLDLTTYPAGQRIIPLIGLGPGAHIIVVKHVSGTTVFRGLDTPARSDYSVVLDGPKVVRTGTWTVNALASTSPTGLSLSSATLGDSVAVTFFGTGLVMAHNIYSSNHVVEVQVDGGAWVSQTVARATADGGTFASDVVASGLPLGAHTVAIRSAGARASLVIYDFTALDETATGYRRDADLSRALRVTA